MLQDNSFPLLIPMGLGPQYLEEAPKVLGETGHAHLPTPLGLPGAGAWPLLFPHTVFCPPPPPQFLAFTCGLLCGALHTLGFQSLVTASVASLPACKSLGVGCLLPLNVVQALGRPHPWSLISAGKGNQINKL